MTLVAEKHLLEKPVGGFDSLLAIGIQSEKIRFFKDSKIQALVFNLPQKFELATNHFSDFVAIGGSSGTATNHIGSQGMDFLTVFVGYNVSTGGSGIGSDDNSTFENGTANGGTGFGGLWKGHVSLLGQKCVPIIWMPIYEILK